MNKLSVAVLGAGSWGTALAIMLARYGHTVRLWGHNAPSMAIMRQERMNAQYLPGISFPATIDVMDDLAAAVKDVQDILVVVPSHVFHHVLDQLRSFLSTQHRICWGTKGIDPQSGQFIHQLVATVCGNQMPSAAIAGPSFAKELAKGLPTALTVASSYPHYAKELAILLSGETTRAYTSDDLIGVQLAGAVKNVIAIAAGISDGIGFGANARCALITRGLAEITRLGVAMGANPTTFMGLAGVGDLVLTCTDDQSRNRRFGIALGKGTQEQEAKRAIGQVVEGAMATEQIYRLSQKMKVEMPITEQVYLLLQHQVTPLQATQNLLLRALKQE